MIDDGDGGVCDPDDYHRQANDGVGDDNIKSNPDDYHRQANGGVGDDNIKSNHRQAILWTKTSSTTGIRPPPSRLFSGSTPRDIDIGILMFILSY